MEIRVAIVEDSQLETKTLKEFFLKFGERENISFHIKSYESGESFLVDYQPVYDMILMDIGLPKMNGMDAASQLRQIDETVMLVFVTNMAQFAVSGYSVNAFDFILKPIYYTHFELKMQRMVKHLSSRVSSPILINDGNDIQRLSASHLQYVEVQNHDLVYHTTGGLYHSHGTLKEAEKQLNSSSFARCNRCYLVNLNYVESINGNIVRVGTDDLQIGRTRRKEFIEALNRYLGGLT